MASVNNQSYSNAILEYDSGNVAATAFRPVRPVSPMPVAPISVQAGTVISAQNAAGVLSLSKVSGEGGVPEALLSIAATQEPVAENNQVASEVFVTFTRDPSDPNFDFVNIWVLGYQGSTTPALVATGSASPITFILQATKETIVVYGQTASTSEAQPLSEALSTTVTLSGVISAPPAPTIEQSLTAIPNGYQFSFNQVDLSGTEDVIACYRVYRSLGANVAGASLLTTIAPSATLTGAIVFQDTSSPGTTYYYWVSSVDTSGLESTKTAAQSGAITAAPGFGQGKNLLTNPGFETNLIDAPSGTQTTLNQTLCDGWTIIENAQSSIWGFDRATVGADAHSGGCCAQIFIPSGVSIATGGNEGQIGSALIPCRGGDVFAASAYANNTIGKPSGSFTFEYGIAVQFFTTSGSAISDVTALGSGSGYQQINLSATAPSNAAYVQFFVFVALTNSTGSAYSTGADDYCAVFFDDTSLVLLVNSDYEIQDGTVYLRMPVTPSISTNNNSVLSNSGSATVIDVAAFTLTIGSLTINCNSGSVDPGSYGTWYVYFELSAYVSGTITPTYLATATESTIVSNPYYLLVGVITTVASTPTDYGYGYSKIPNPYQPWCFSGNAEIETVDGWARLDSLPDFCTLKDGTTASVLRHANAGAVPLHEMPDGVLVTAGHLVWWNQWVPAGEIFPATDRRETVLYNLEFSNPEHQLFFLKNGWIAH